MLTLSDAAAIREFLRFLAEPFGIMIFVAGMAFALVPIAADRSKHRPGNVAPIQLISAAGAWALILLNQAILVSSLQQGSPIVACASFATNLTTVWLFCRRNDGRITDLQVPETIEAMICEMEQILGGALRVGIKSMDAVIVEKTGPLIGVSVSRRGHVVVRMRRELIAWLERHRRPGGAGSAAVEGFLRFTILHEIGHVLNGDHLTYRFVRSVLLAHLCWVPAPVIATVLLPWLGPAAQTVLATTLCLELAFLGQCRLARHFLAEREEAADLRAMQTLDPSNASLLGTRRGRRTDRQNPTLLEQLMTDLHVQRPVIHANWYSKGVQWVWPESGHIHERCEMLALGHGRRVPQPNQWAAFLGMQCGLLCISLLACASAAFGSLPFWRPGTVLGGAVMLMTVTCSMAATYCGMRVDPALVRLHDLVKVPSRRTTGLIFYYSFSASALLLYLLPAFSGISAVLSYPLLSVAIGMSAAAVLFGSLMAAGGAKWNPEDATVSLRHPLLQTVPVLLVTLSIITGCSAVAACAFGLGGVGSRVWIDVWIIAGAGAMTTYAMSRSTSAVVRAFPPIAWLESSGCVFAIRIFWREIYYDRHITSNRVIILLGLSTSAATAFMFACGGALVARLMSGIATDYVIHEMLMLMSAVLVGLMFLVPQRTDKTAHLTDLEHLRMLDALLTAVQIAGLPVAEELGGTVARWMSHDADIPSIVLPAPRAVWKLESLLLLVRMARAVGEEKMVARWRSTISNSLRRIVTDGAVSVNGSRPSLAYTVLAAQIIEEADLLAEIPLQPILDSIADGLERCLNGEEDSSIEAVTSACLLLAANGRTHLGIEQMWIRSLMTIEYLLGGPTIRQRLCEIAAYIAPLEDTAVRDRLVNIVRARIWEALQLNPGNDVSLLLDCYLAAVSLGESNSQRLSLAESTIGEVAARLADEMTTIHAS
jgi:hypothetical protein